MGKTRRKQKGSSAPPRGRLGLAVAAAFFLVVLAGLATWMLLPKEGTTGETAQFRGGPRLAVDQDLIDFGAVRYNQFVEARFRLKNVGDQPLQLPASPPLEVVEGC